MVVQGQVACETLYPVVVSLRASLNGAILETLRIAQRQGGVSSSWPDGEECPERSVVWGRLQARLSNERERRLAYLLYHCGLDPAEIVRSCPQEWSDVHEVARLRHSILVRLPERPCPRLATQGSGMQPTAPSLRVAGAGVVNYPL